MPPLWIERDVFWIAPMDSPYSSISGVLQADTLSFQVRH